MAQDVLALLKQEHQAVEALLQRFDKTDPSGRSDYFCEVVHTLVGHEVAEEQVVYPALREESSQGDEVASARIEEQAEAEQALADLEDLDPESSAFASSFLMLRKDVLAHAQAEERTAFPLLEQGTTGQQRQELAERYLKARDRAPTHPHPHAPDSPPGNVLLGPIAALADRARDAARQA